MPFIHVDQVVIPPERARKEFDVQALKELRESILSQGLFHPILLRRDARTLVAGERRLRVLRDIYFEKGPGIVFNGAQLDPGIIPCTVLALDDELDVLQSELDENKRRASLTWQEEAAHIARIHLILKEHNADHTVIKTARAYERNDQFVRNSIVLAPFLEDPEIAKAKSLDEGLKLLEKKLERGHREAVAKALGGRASNNLHTLSQGDCRQLIAGLPDAHFDCIMADPPYGVDAHLWANMSGAEHPYEDTKEYSNELYERLAIEGFRVTKLQAHAYFFCDIRRSATVMHFLGAAGWRVWPWPLIFWRGPANGVCPWPEHGPRRTFEGIVFAIKGDRRALGVFPDVLAHFDRDGEERGAHKPAALYADLLARSCLPGDEVLDPCLGTGAILDAATSRRVRVTGFEIEAASFARARERLA